MLKVADQVQKRMACECHKEWRSGRGVVIQAEGDPRWVIVQWDRETIPSFEAVKDLLPWNTES